MLLGNQISVRCPASGEKLPDGVCFYLEGVPAGTTILGTCGKVTSADSEWTIDFGDETGVQTFSTTANIPEHTYSEEGDYIIQIVGSGITKIGGVSASYYPVIATTAKADCPYVKKITVGSDFSFFPLGPYSVLASRSISGRWAMFSQLDEIVLSKSVKTCALAGCLAYVFSYKPVVFVAPGLESIEGALSLRYSYYVNPVSVLPKKQPSVDYSYFLAGAKITSLDGMPSGITGNLGAYCFQGCVNLTDVSGLPPGITGSANYAFSGCTSLKIANLPHIEKLCSSDFSGCTELTDIYVKGVGHTSSTTSASNFLTTAIAPNVTLHYTGDVPSYDCKYATYLKHLDVSNSSSIGALAFNNCTGLIEIAGEEGITSFGNQCFDNCTSLTGELSLDSATSVGSYAFARSLITGVSFGSSVTIKSSAFYGCASLESISSSGVTKIDTSAFSGCSGLTSVSLGGGSSISGSNSSSSGTYASFFGCTSLSNISCSGDLTVNGAALYGCSALETINTSGDLTLINRALAGVTGTPTISTGGKIVLGYNSFVGFTQDDIERLVLPVLDKVCISFGGSVADYGAFGESGIDKDTAFAILRGRLKTPGQYAYQLFYRCNNILGDVSLTENDVEGFASVQSIFGGCTGITGVTWNIDVNNAGLSTGYPFSGCVNISRFDVYGFEHLMRGSAPVHNAGTKGSGVVNFYDLKDIGYDAEGNKVSVGNVITGVSTGDLIFHSLEKIHASADGYNSIFALAKCSRIMFPKLETLENDSSSSKNYLFYGDSTSSVGELHFNKDNRDYFVGTYGYDVKWGLSATTTWTGKIYFDLNEDGTVATNPDGSAIEPEYDGSQS